MLASLHPTASSPRLYPPSCCAATASASTTSGSCRTRLFVGLKPWSEGAYGNGRSNLTVDFHAKVHQSLRVPNSKPTCARVTMMPIGLPRVPYRSPGEGAWQWVDLWNALYRERIIFIGERITEEFSNQVLATLLYLDSIESSKKIHLFISSPGGDLTPSLALYDTVQSLKNPVGTRCISYATDIAAYILAAGEKGSRTGMPMCRIVLQSPEGTAHGRADDLFNETNELVRIRDYLFNELAKKTGQPLEKIYKDLRNTKHFSAQEAVEYGLIDRVVRPARIKAEIGPDKQSNTGLG